MSKLPLSFSQDAMQNKQIGAQSFTIFLQVFSEDVAGLGSLGGVVQRNVSVDVLQQNIHPGLSESTEDTNKLSFHRGHSSDLNR